MATTKEFSGQYGLDGDDFLHTTVTQGTNLVLPTVPAAKPKDDPLSGVTTHITLSHHKIQNHDFGQNNCENNIAEVKGGGGRVC